MQRVDKSNFEMKLQKALALEFVKDYCTQKGYSIEKLSHCRFKILYNECAFLRSSSVPHNGLVNDMETLPQVVLMIKHNNNKLIIEETEYTQKYLCCNQN